MKVIVIFFTFVLFNIAACRQADSGVPQAETATFTATKSPTSIPGEETASRPKEGEISQSSPREGELPEAVASPEGSKPATNTPEPEPTQTPRPQASNTPVPTPTPTIESLSMMTGIVAADGVNLRSGPDTNYTLIGTMTLSQTFQIVSRNQENSWWQICCLDSEANLFSPEDEIWVSAEFIQTTTPVTKLLELTPLIEFPRDFTGRITGEKVNLRRGPSTDFKLIGEIMEGETVTVIGRNADSTWWYVCCSLEKDENAWIYSQYLDFPAKEAEKRLPLVEVNAPTAPAAPTKAEVEPVAVAASAPFTISVTGVISGDRVNLRAGPGTTYEKMGAITGGQSIQIISQNENGDWRQICCPAGHNENSWISAQFIISQSKTTSATIPVIAAEAEAPAPETQIAAKSAAPAVPAPEPDDVLPGPGVFSPPKNINPFTGLPLPANKRDQRPVIVCINNDPSARPQFGLSQADVMYEYNMEGYYITRFSGLFYGEDPEQIGPVRSARLVNYHLGALYNAPLFCSGASDKVRFILKNFAPFPYLDVDLDDRSNNLYTISVGKNYRTRVRTNRDFLNTWLEDWNIEAPANVRGFTFGDLPSGGVLAESINIPYTKATGSYVDYTYNAASGQYLRSQGGEPHTDSNNGERLALDNVIIQYTPHTDTDIVEDSLGSLSLRITLFGSGPALVFRNGMVFTTTWRSQTRGDLPSFFDETGAEIPLKPGKTWISIVPHNAVIKYD